jgi:hypothetical protein
MPRTLVISVANARSASVIHQLQADARAVRLAFRRARVVAMYSPRSHHNASSSAFSACRRPLPARQKSFDQSAAGTT